MQTVERAADRRMKPVPPDPGSPWARRLRAVTGGGTTGNQRLTSTVSAILVVLLALLGVTILGIGQLIWLHLFLGLVLLGPLAVKMASTGYRFARYYTRSMAYRREGPPVLALRLLAPVVVASTVLVFASGILLLGAGPRDQNPWLLLHKASFVVWLVATGVHVLGHLPTMVRTLTGGRSGTELPGSVAGAAGRRIVLAGALVGGLVLAVALIPEFGTWTAHAALWNHDH